MANTLLIAKKMMADAAAAGHRTLDETQVRFIRSAYAGALAAIWFSNNQSERDLRPTKLQLKISATWRSLQGLADFATLRSYLSTATKHGEDLLDVLTALFTTGPWLPPDPAR
jgi:transposase